MPSGESLVRQIAVGRRYFDEKFGKRPTVAVNFDSFGHTEGLVQILQKCGYKGYLCTRPDTKSTERDFIWKGFCDSEILLHRAPNGYNTQLGHVGDKLPYYLERLQKVDCEMFLWGVGNHGGGPSRQDLKWLDDKCKNLQSVKMLHSTPEAYFDDLDKTHLPILSEPLNYMHQASYTSQIRIKQLHFKLENELYATEKLASYAAMCGKTYPTAKLESAERDLLFCEFHDILPGTSIKEAEEASIKVLSHGLEDALQAKTSAFFALCEGQAKAEIGEYPIFIANPHPFAVKKVFEAELMLADQNWSKEKMFMPELTLDGKKIPFQMEKESSNVPIDWRKRITFEAEAAPASVTRVKCKMALVDKPPVFVRKNEEFVFKNDEMSFAFDEISGYPCSYTTVGGHEILGKGFCVSVLKTSEDPWGFGFNSHKETVGNYRLMTLAEACAFAGQKNILPLHIIEDGDVRTVVEGFYCFNESKLCIRNLCNNR